MAARPPFEPPTQEQRDRALTKNLAAVALVATMIGAGVGTAVTLLVGDPGPQGPRGEQGVRGPAGTEGPPGDTSAAEAAVADLEGELADTQTRLDELEASGGAALEGEVEDLDARVSILESIVSDICIELDLFC